MRRSLSQRQEVSINAVKVAVRGENHRNAESIKAVINTRHSGTTLTSNKLHYDKSPQKHSQMQTDG